jgi:hypothetical protein
MSIKEFLNNGGLFGMEIDPIEQSYFGVFDISHYNNVYFEYGEKNTTGKQETQI